MEKKLLEVQKQTKYQRERESTVRIAQHLQQRKINRMVQGGDQSSQEKKAQPKPPLNPKLPAVKSKGQLKIPKTYDEFDKMAS